MQSKGVSANFSHFILIIVCALSTRTFGDLFVSSNSTNSVKRYSGVTGGFLGDFVTSIPNPSGLKFGPDNNLYVTSTTTNQVKRYSPSGAFIDNFASGAGLNSPEGITFGPDGNLYVNNYGGGNIERFNGTTGAFMGVFANPSAQVLDLTFGPDGNLYVTSSFVGVLRFNCTTGASMGTFASTGSAGISSPVGVRFGPDGNLYVCGYGNNDVKKFNGTTGAFIGNFTVGGHMNLPYGLIFGPDDNLYVNGNISNDVERFNGFTGAFIGDFVPAGSGGLSAPYYLTFGNVPEPGLIAVFAFVMALGVRRPRASCLLK